ncbi:MAG: RagB/SusD family nutrient uptake outer membrane protein, partial [Mediterranea sp.]|nr:RagB/SusD family nutrient uptake outer membrane protein [Mediterranea sp.]
DMVRSYGGVPLILNEQRLDDDLNVSRAKTSECITQIVKDLDDAIAFGEDFPIKWTGNDAGRISRAVALALKARILLYYACPQFSKETPAGTKSVEVRWQEAYAANQAAVQQLSAAGYGLFRPNPADAEEAIQNYSDMFTEDNEIDTNPEMVWVRRYAYPIATSGIDEAFRGGMGVPLEMTNAFAKADGTPYTDLVLPAAGAPGSTLATSTVPFWKDREPRFYTTIAYNGCIFPLYVSGSGLTGDEDATGRLKHFYLFNGGQAPYGDPRRMESSGLSMRKFIDDAQKYHTTDGNRSGRDWPLIRYAEVLLNYAETAVKTGHESDALQVLRDIRKRAGIPQGTNNYGIGTPSGDALILTILKERQVELAYESFRYYDLRRWRVYTDALNGFKLNGMVRHGIKPDPKGGYPTYEALAALDIANDPASYFDMFEDQIHSLDANPINFTERQYFYRLSYEGHIKKNPKLEQTILWEGGTFNPYE